MLITKIRSTKSAETHNYKKATKALLVLIPLLGITFSLDMINPSSTGLLVNIYKFSKVVIISTQVNTTIIIIRLSIIYLFEYRLSIIYPFERTLYTMYFFLYFFFTRVRGNGAIFPRNFFTVSMYLIL